MACIKNIGQVFTCFQKVYRYYSLRILWL